MALPRPTPDAPAWTGFSVDVEAEDSTVTIAFEAERGGDDSSFALDDLCLGARESTLAVRRP